MIQWGAPREGEGPGGEFGSFFLPRNGNFKTHSSVSHESALELSDFLVQAFAVTLQKLRYFILFTGRTPQHPLQAACRMIPGPFSEGPLDVRARHTLAQVYAARNV